MNNFFGNVHCSLFNCHLNPRSLPEEEEIALTRPVHSCEIVCCYEPNLLHDDVIFDLRRRACVSAIAFYRSATERHCTRPERRGGAWRDCDAAFPHYRC